MEMLGQEEPVKEDVKEEVAEEGEEEPKEQEEPCDSSGSVKRDASREPSPSAKRTKTEEHTQLQVYPKTELPDPDYAKETKQVPFQLIERLMTLHRESIEILRTWSSRCETETNGGASMDSEKQVLSACVEEMEGIVAESRAMYSKFKEKEASETAKCLEDKNDMIEDEQRGKEETSFAAVGKNEGKKAEPAPARKGNQSRNSGGGTNCNIFVFHLPEDWTDDDLLENFIGFGDISSAKVMMEGNRSRGFGFVQFDDRLAAETAVNKMNGMKVEGAKESKRLKVEFKRGHSTLPSAKGPEKKEPKRKPLARY